MVARSLGDRAFGAGDLRAVSCRWSQKERARWVALSCVFALVGCARPPAPPVAAVNRVASFGKAPGSPSTRSWFRPARASEVVALEAGIAGDRVATLVDLPNDSCGVFIARGTDTIEDLDLLAYADDGATLGLDEGPDKTPALLICPPHPTRIYVVARIAQGHGLVAIGVERVAPQDAQAAAETYHAHQREDETAARLSAWPGLAERVAEQRRRLGGKWSDIRRVAVPLDARVPTRVSANVEENRCLHALVLASEEVSHVELSALDENGRILGRGAAFGRDRSLIVCSPSTSPISFELRPQGGRGVAVLVLSQSEPGRARSIDEALRIERYPLGTLEETRQERAARLVGLGYKQAVLLRHGNLRPGILDSAYFSLPKGCSRIDILTAAPVRDIAVRLWGADDSLLAEGTAGGSQVLFACSAGGPARLDTETMTRPGEYSVELRQEQESLPELESNPLAASRLLAQLLDRGLIRSVSQAGKINVHHLSPEHLDTERFLVPLGRCMELTLALGAGSSGAEVRLVDEASGEELALGRGTHGANASVCAIDARSGGTIHARAELRVEAGPEDGLTTTHMSTPAR